MTARRQELANMGYVERSNWTKSIHITHDKTHNRELFGPELRELQRISEEIDNIIIQVEAAEDNAIVNKDLGAYLAKITKQIDDIMP